VNPSGRKLMLHRRLRRQLLLEDSEQVLGKARQLAKEARIEVLRMTSQANAPHVGSALSVIDILSVLYSGGANIYPANSRLEERDVVLLSKGHAASALYAILGIKDFFPLNNLENYCENGSLLGGHVTSSGLPGIELSTGSLGHALPYGVGISLMRKLEGKEGNVFVVISDGECDEGTTWESALLANHHCLHNLTVVLDRNRLQSLKDTEVTLKLEPLKDKWTAFGWAVFDVDGHNYAELLSAIWQEQFGPKLIIANTTKGRGVSFMENSVLWHYRSLGVDELDAAIEEILQAR